MSPLISQSSAGLTYLSLEDLKELEIEFANQAARIFAAEGPSGPEWLLRAKVHGVEATFRAHRAVAAEVAS